MPAIPVDVTQRRDALEASPPPTWLPGLRQSLPDRRNHASRDHLLHRIRAEFEELRGLKLTLPQARRLFTLREDVCLRVLNTLVRDGLLWVTPERLYARR